MQAPHPSTEQDVEKLHGYILSITSELRRMESSIDQHRYATKFFSYIHYLVSTVTLIIAILIYLQLN